VCLLLDSRIQTWALLSAIGRLGPKDLEHFFNLQFLNLRAGLLVVFLLLNKSLYVDVRRAFVDQIIA